MMTDISINDNDLVMRFKKLRKVAKENNALIVTGHDPVGWLNFKKAPMFFYE